MIEFSSTTVNILRLFPHQGKIKFPLKNICMYKYKDFILSVYLTNKEKSNRKMYLPQFVYYYY